MQLYTFSTHKDMKYKINECGKMCKLDVIIGISRLSICVANKNKITV